MMTSISDRGANLRTGAWRSLRRENGAPGLLAACQRTVMMKRNAPYNTCGSRRHQSLPESGRGRLIKALVIKALVIKALAATT
jgi:hypothetical protein